jgi:ABC-2 type transport system ATP-binding protein
MADIEVEQLTKRFGDFCAVDALSFSVPHGEVFGLLGPNGAGKSTLIRMLTTLVLPSSGAARVGGHDIARDATAVRRCIGVIPQMMTSDLDLTGDENMRVHALLHGLGRAQATPIIDELLAAVDLLDWRDKPLKTYSGGMRRRLEIARGLVHRPRIFFLDEPTTGLDPVSRAAVWELLNRLRGDQGLTVLMSTHYMDEADKLCDRVAIMDHGKLVALDSPLRLKASIPGSTMIEAGFSSIGPGWVDTLRKLPGVTHVKAEGNLFRISTDNGPRTTVALMEVARQANAEVASLTVQSTTLDDVFVHFTGHALREPEHATGGVR